MSKIKRISHITWICKNIEKTANMLKEIFDAEEIYSSEEKIFSISKEKFFKIAGIWIAIMEGESTEKTYNHIAFEVEMIDLPFFEKKILALDLTMLPGRKRNSAEGQSIYFYDYDNHLFELHGGNLETRLRYYNDKK